MTSAARTNEPGRGGFTLIEIVMVLVITAIIVGGAIAIIAASSDERKLTDISGEVELLAKRARTTSMLQQTPYALEFREGVVRLMPLAEAGADEKTTALGRTIGGDRVAAEPPAGRRPPARAEYRFPPGLNVVIRRWNSNVWLTTEKNSLHIWRFDPNGLCEPITLRYELEKSWAQDTFHPLTATIRESLLEAQ
jgi:prepilin-type N-terminal cleavage/methylation domain-containing protein